MGLHEFSSEARSQCGYAIVTTRVSPQARASVCRDQVPVGTRKGSRCEQYSVAECLGHNEIQQFINHYMALFD